MLDEAFEQAREFFKMPYAKKMELDNKLGNSFKGYVRTLIRHNLCC